MHRQTQTSFRGTFLRTKAPRSLKYIFTYLLCLVTVACSAVLLGGTAAEAGEDLICCSTRSSGWVGNDSSRQPAISADGRYVAFSSNADDLLGEGKDYNHCEDVFRKDLQTGQIVRCSTTASGGEVFNTSFGASISADGKYVAFSSEATGLLGPGRDRNKKYDVFRKDLETGGIVRCSTTASGGEANGDSWGASISADGRYVAIESRADNLLGRGKDKNPGDDVFRKDLRTGSVVLCSLKSVPDSGMRDNSKPAISADGRYVVFESAAGFYDECEILRKDVQTGKILRCSTDSSGVAASEDSHDPSISADGRYVAFDTYAGLGDDSNGVYDVFRKDFQTGQTICCSTDSTGSQREFDSCNPSMSSDGRYISFEACVGDHVGPALDEDMTDIYRKDLLTGQMTCCSTGATGGRANGPSNNSSISSDGRCVAFDSEADNLIGKGNDLNGQERDVFRKEISYSVYFAEGTCRPGFDPFICMQNPGGEDAEVTITYMKGDGTTDTQELKVKKRSRSTVVVKDRLGEGDDPNHDFSTRVECTNGQGIVVERPVYFNYKGIWDGGHDTIGFTP